MHIVHACDAPTFELTGVRFTAFAAPSRGSAETCVWELTVDPGHQSDQPHTLDHDEVFLVLAGAVRLAPGAEEISAGDVAVVPAGEPIQIANTGTEPARLHVAIRAGFTATAADGSSIGTPPWAA